MKNEDNEKNDLFDEIIDDEEEEIKEDIVIENDDDNKNQRQNEKILTTYDKFLLDSVAIDGLDNKNEYHYILKNQMANIIGDIKKKQNEEQRNKNNIKKMIFQNMENIFFNKDADNNKLEEENKVSYDNNINGIKNNSGKNININQYTLNPQQIQKANNKKENNQMNRDDFMENLRDLDVSNDKTEKINSKENIDINNNIEISLNEENNKSINLSVKKNRGYLNNKNEEPDSKEYNINIEDFLKDNMTNDEDIVNNATNLNIDNSQNNVNYKNQNYDSEKKNNVENKNIQYTVMGNPELKKKIKENYDYFTQKKKNTINSKI